MNTSRIWGFPYTGVVRNTQKKIERKFSFGVYPYTCLYQD